MTLTPPTDARTTWRRTSCGYCQSTTAHTDETPRPIYCESCGRVVVRSTPEVSDD